MKFDDSVKKVFRDYAEALVLAIVLAVILRAFVVTAYKIPTSSMSPTLKIGDFILVNRLSYGLRLPILGDNPLLFTSLPERGDVVVFKCPQDPEINCVKRVVGLPGDRIQIVKKNLLVNEKKAEYREGDSDLIAGESGSEFYAVVVESFEEKEYEILITTKSETEEYGPVIVPPGQFFVLGDSRDSSDDSRYWGGVPLVSLQAKVMFIWLSIDWSPTWRGEGLPKLRWERLFQGVN